MNYLANIIPTQSTCDYIIPLISIPIIDILLCKGFGSKSRWFQLHSVINAVIVYIIWNDVICLITNPIINVRQMNSIMEYENCTRNTKEYFVIKNCIQEIK